MEKIAEKLKEILIENGAVVVGYGDVSDIVAGDLKTGISVLRPMPPEMIVGIEKDVTEEYRQWYIDTNNILDKAIKAGAEYLRSEGYEVKEYTTDKVVRDANNCTELPLKSLAIRAGLGWIGKSCILVTPQYGGALRLSGMITNAPLPVAEPMFQSQCGDCTKCMEICPYDAIKGTTWEKGMEREEIVDQAACASGALKRCREVLGVDMTICGKCFVFCPYTRKYIEG